MLSLLAPLSFPFMLFLSYLVMLLVFIRFLVTVKSILVLSLSELSFSGLLFCTVKTVSFRPYFLLAFDKKKDLNVCVCCYDWM